LRKHLDGISFRKLGDEAGFSQMSAYRRCLLALSKLPHLADVTRHYCNRFSGILLVDGKFVKVAGLKDKIPVIYGIDYLTHDIPTYVFSVSENYLSLLKFFQALRLLNYPLKSIVSDDNLNIPEACFKVYPQASWQLCTNHFKENIRKSLEIRTNPFYQPFMQRIENLFRSKISLDNFNKLAKETLQDYLKDELCVRILLDIERRKSNLLAYLQVKGTPTTNNLIECFNSHLQGRLETIKGFASFKHAELWLNGYFLRRRCQKFTDCEGKFKHLNNKTSLGQTLKRNLDLPRFF